MCKRTRWKGVKQAAIDALFGTLQDVSGDNHLRERTHFADRMTVDDASRTSGETGAPDHH